VGAGQGRYSRCHYTCDLLQQGVRHLAFGEGLGLQQVGLFATYFSADGMHWWGLHGRLGLALCLLDFDKQGPQGISQWAGRQAGLYAHMRKGCLECLVISRSCMRE
jgi:hypothetical protein